MSTIYDDIEKILKDSGFTKIENLVNSLRVDHPSVSTLEVRAAIIALWEADKVEVNGEVIGPRVCKETVTV